jgi:hypothetical protein
MNVHNSYSEFNVELMLEEALKTSNEFVLDDIKSSLPINMYEKCLESGGNEGGIEAGV